jgi:hypothetical protein
MIFSHVLYQLSYLGQLSRFYTISCRMSSRNGQQRVHSEAATDCTANRRAVLDTTGDLWGDVHRLEEGTDLNTSARHASSRPLETADTKRGGERWAPRLSDYLS